MAVLEVPVTAPNTRRWEMVETIPTVMAARVLRGSKAYTTKTMNRKNGTWGQWTQRVNMAQDHVGGEVLSLSVLGKSHPWDRSSLLYMV